MTPRDGPISAIDPSISGVYVENTKPLNEKNKDLDTIESVSYTHLTLPTTPYV